MMLVIMSMSLPASIVDTEAALTCQKAYITFKMANRTLTTEMPWSKPKL